MKIFFIRHGETDNNVKNIMQGAGMDTPLNVQGIQQAKELAEKAVKESFEVGIKLGGAISDLIDTIFE